MLIAVTYENGNVFQHFGHTEYFKLYEVEDGEIKSSHVMDTNGTGHEALAGLLANNAVGVLICGGMGQGASDALTAAGLEVISGVTGNTDEAVAAYLRGELVSSGVNCDHHDHEHGHSHDHSHGHGHSHSYDQSNDFDQSSACGAGCEGCGSDNAAGCTSCPGCGGGESVYFFEGKNVGKVVKVHYEGTLDNGEKFDSSYDREPLEFTCGIGSMIRGFDKAVADMEIGDVINVHIEPEEAYGPHDDRYIITMSTADIPETEELHEGDQVMLQDEMGRPFEALVSYVDDEKISFDLNHPMAGKALNFKIELLDIR